MPATIPGNRLKHYGPVTISFGKKSVRKKTEKHRLSACKLVRQVHFKTLNSVTACEENVLCRGPHKFGEDYNKNLCQLAKAVLG
jgi:hypothetical protein